MNQGQFQALVNEVRQLNRQLDEIRRAVNRIDGRLKERNGEISVTLEELFQEPAEGDKD